MDNNSLPKYTKNQQNGDIAANIFSKSMSHYCRVMEIPQKEDLGIDFICATLKNEYPTTLNFYVQCKGAEDIENKAVGDNMFTYKIKTSTVNFWKTKKDPTFLFLIDEKSEKMYWTAPLHELETRKCTNNKTITFHIPRKNCLNSNEKELPEEFIFEIIRYYANFSSALVEQLKKLEEGTTDIQNEEYLMKIINIIEKNTNKINAEQESIKNKLIQKIRQDIQDSSDYFHNIDQVDKRIVNKYCPKGVFNESFPSKYGDKTIRQFQQETKKILQNKDVSITDLVNFSRNLLHFEINIFVFFREMANEDLPYIPKPEIDEKLYELEARVSKLFN